MNERKRRVTEWASKNPDKVDELKIEKFMLGMIPRYIVVDMEQKFMELKQKQKEIENMWDEVSDELAHPLEGKELRDRLEYLGSRVLTINPTTRTVYDLTAMWEHLHGEEEE